jgi:transcriptional regulator with XRE-family HTH domain
MHHSIAIAIARRKPVLHSGPECPGYPLPVDGEPDELTRCVSEFLARFCLEYFPKKESRAKVKIDQNAAAEVLGCSQGYVSELLRQLKAPGLTLVLRLHQLTGESVETITGIEPPPATPAYPLRSATALSRARALLRDGDAGAGADAEPEGKVGRIPNRRRRAV